MKKPRVLRSWSKRNLPDELWPEILSWLPVKALLRFRSVSRSWKLIIDDPDFGRSHLNRFNNRHEPRLFFVQRAHCECIVKNSTTLRTKFRLGFLQSDLESPHVFRTTPARTYGGFVKWYVVSSIDGLFMLNSTNSSDLMLWNPSLRKTLTLPPSPESIDAINVDFGLGFDPTVRDYKLVRFVLARSGGVRFVAIYTLGANSWKAVEFRGEFRQDFIFDYGKRSVPFNGALYALATDAIRAPVKLVSFDLRSEVFASFGLPAIDRSESEWLPRNQAIAVVDDGCSLALVSVSEPKGFVWVLEGLGDDAKSWSWIRRFSFDTVCVDFDLRFLCFKTNGEMLLKESYWVRCYDLETQQVKTMLHKNKKEFKENETYPYIESLLLHH